MNCGKSVSTEVPDGTIVRAWVECPECIEKDPRFVRDDKSLRELVAEVTELDRKVWRRQQGK
jgi:hypothetical protein